MKNFILSPCGTSLLMNRINIDSERKLINKYSNCKNSSEISKEDIRVLQEILLRAQEKLAMTPLKEAYSLSAEINPLLRFYEETLDDKQQDYHVLLCTDTWIGEQTANLIAEWLTNHNLKNVEILRQKDLRTVNVDEFQLALSDLVRWCEDTIPGYRNNHYKIVFNLTGGFKSVQGFLQTLAMFYADESIYIFETQKELLRIPRLPIEITVDDVFRQNLTLIRRLSLGLDVPIGEIQTLPETLILRVDNLVTLSPLGELMWRRSKHKIYSEKLWSSPSKKIIFSESFEKSIRNLPADRLVLVNKKIDQLVRYLESDGNGDLKSLDFKKLVANPKPPSTHEMDAWSDRDAKRIFGHYKEGVFVLDELDNGLH